MNTNFTPWRALAAAVPALVLAFAPAAARANEGWGTSFEAAKATAAKEKKDILMDFTGSDWCGWCIKLKEEVFTKDAFKQEAPKHFVLLELDFPQQKELPKEEKEQNEKLQETYKIEGFPTILLTDETGRPYAKTGYQPDGPEAYNKHLAELRKVHETRDAAFAKAAKAEGLEKAKALAEGLSAIDPDLVQAHYQAETDQVIALDTEDTLGLKAKKAYAGKRAALEEKLTQFAQDNKSKEFGEALDEFIANEKPTGINLQDLLFTKLTVLGPSDIEKAAAIMDEVIKIDPKSELGERASSVKEKIALMRKQIEESKKEEQDKAKEKEAESKEKEAPPAAPEKKE